MKLDGAELRRRNMIRPEQMPYKNPMGQTYDVGQFEKMLDQGLIANAFVLDEERLVRYSTLARQTQREDMLAAVLKGASLEAFALKLTDLPSASDEGAGLAMLSESDEAVPSAPAGATGSGGLIDAMLRMPLESGAE